jgi:predicted anti-sigma-YlaC factor YlaD
LSARLDGEALKVDEEQLDAHLEACGACRLWQGAAQEATRRMRLSASPRIPDRTAELLAAVTADTAGSGEPRRTRLIRFALLGVALAQIGAVVFVAALAGRGQAHTAREVAAFSLALAVGFGIAAVRPQRAPAMAPLVGVAALALVTAAGLDLAGGHIHLLEEVPHVLVAVGWFLLHRLSRLQGPSGQVPSPDSRRWVWPRRRRLVSGEAGTWRTHPTVTPLVPMAAADTAPMARRTFPPTGAVSSRRPTAQRNCNATPRDRVS